MTDVAWVSERYACTLKAVFQRLREMTERDVDVRNRQRGDGDKYVFEIRSDSEFKADFYVVRGETNMKPQNVAFYLTESGIHVESNADADHKILFDATVAIDDEGKCRLIVKGKPLEEWQVRKSALESLFFFVHNKWL